MKPETFPSGMSEEAFRGAYRAHLDGHTAVVVALLRKTLARTDVSPDVDHVHLEAFPDEYGDGLLSVMMYFEGKNRQVRKNNPTLYSGAHVDLTAGLRVPLHGVDAYDFDTVDASMA